MTDADEASAHDAIDADAPADAVKGNWVELHAPGPIKPYLRLMRADRPIGAWLLFIPCLWGLGLASAEGSGGWSSLPYVGLFAVGAFLMRGAGCAYNDIADHDFDARVERTAQRPIPAGQISIANAWMFLFGLCFLALAILLQFNSFTIILGVSSLALVAIYPFMKRITYWPQLWLGLTFNWGALMGYAAVTGVLSWSAAAIYFAGVFWTLGYDTIYAHQDKEDDMLIGVKSAALRLGSLSRIWIAGFYTATIALFVLVGVVGDMTRFYFLGLTPAILHFGWQVMHLNINAPEKCLKLFRSNREAGLLLVTPMLLEILALIL